MKFKELQTLLLRVDKQNLAKNLGYHNFSKFKNSISKIT